MRVDVGNRIASRVAGIAPSATLAVDAKAKALQAKGQDVVNFGAGEPDFPTPEWIVDAAAEACRDQRNHRYTPTAGLPGLRSAVAAKTTRDSGFVVTPEQVLITNGAKQALFEAFATLLDPGDEVLLPTPYWTTYPEAIALAGGVSVPIITGASSGFKVTVDQLVRATTDRTKVLLFVSPSNPTGAVYSRDEMEAIGQWATQVGLWVITDEIYEHLVYDPARFHSMPVVVPELADRVIVVNGVSKTFAMTGWRVGWMIGPTDIVRAANNLHSHMTSNVSNVSQRAALAAVDHDLSFASSMRAVFDRRRRLVCSGLSGLPGVTCLEPDGAFYVFPDVSGMLNREIAGRIALSTLQLADIILDEIQIAIVPGEAFGAPGFIRLSYALDDAALVKGIDRFAAFATRVAQ